MKLIIAGSRTVEPTDEEIAAAFDSLVFVFADVTLVICGMAKGADLAGKRWAASNSIPVHEEPVTREDYKKHGGYLAPKMRNRAMAELGDAAIVFWDGTSGGAARPGVPDGGAGQAGEGGADATGGEVAGLTSIRIREYAPGVGRAPPPRRSRPSSRRYMARHRSKLAKKFRSKKRSAEPGKPKHRSKYRRSAKIVKARRNPSSTWMSGFPAVDWVETGKLVGVGFGAFAVGRLATRIVAVQVAKRKPTWGKHAGVLANAATFAAALFLSRKWSKSRPYEMPLVIGSGLSFLQTFVQTYFPKLGWMVSDATADEIAQASGQQQVQPATTGYLPDDDGDVEDDESWSSYNDAYDQGRHARSAQPGNQPPPPSPPPRPVPANGANGAHEEGGGVDQDEVDEMLSELDDTQMYAN